MPTEMAETELVGVLLVDKPAGPTSHDVVQRARRALGVGRIGHTGTLDPFATGLLLLCVGRATRLVRYFHELPKTYHADLELGVETSTHDPEGEVVVRSDAWRSLHRSRVEEVLERHTGLLEQVPPAYSAKRVEGERAHRRARRGEDVELPAEEVRVERLELLEFDPPRVVVEATVSTGTYVRALARDVGRELECGAHLRQLRRTAVGPFRVEDGIPTGELEATDAEFLVTHAAWRSPASALPWLPRRRLDGDERERVGHGARVPLGAVANATSPVLLVHDDRLVAVAEVLDDELQPRVVFPDR